MMLICILARKYQSHQVGGKPFLSLLNIFFFSGLCWNVLSWSIYVGNFGKLASYYWPLLSHSSPSIPACHIFWKWPQLQPWISAFWLQIIIPLWLELYSLIIRYADTDGYYSGFHFGVFGFCQGRYWQNT